MMGSTRLFGLGLYALSVMLLSGGNFLTTLLLIKAMSPEGFSRWALMEPILLALIPLCGLGMNFGLLQKVSAQPDRAATVLAEIFPFYMVTSLVLSLAAFSIFLITLGNNIILSASCAAVVFGEGGLLLFMALWRAQNKPGSLFAVDGLRALALTCAVFVVVSLVAIPSLATQTYLTLRLALAMAVVVLACLLVRPDWRPRRATAVSAMRYGLPITLASFLGTWFLNVDRYAVHHVGDVLQLTQYVAHGRIAQLLPMMTLAPFFLWFAPKAMRAVAERGAALKEVARITLAYTAVLFWASMNLWLLAPLVWPLVFPQLAFDPVLFGINLVSAALFSLANPLSIGTLGDRKTYASLLVSAGGLALALAATFAFGALGGLHGVAFGRTAAMLAYTVAFAVFTVRTTGIRYYWPAMAALACAFLLLALGVQALHPAAIWLDIPAQLLAANLVTAAVAGVLFRRRGRGLRLPVPGRVPHTLEATHG
jgi:O-antigen/teichoic acid export membrane protein